MENQAEYTPALGEGALALGEAGRANPRTLEQPAEFYAVRVRFARNRAVPATKRGRRLQALAIAVAEELELRADVRAVLEAEVQEAEEARREAYRVRPTW